MAFHNQPLTLRIRAKAGNPVVLDRAVLVVRYALLEGESVAKKPEVLGMLRGGRLPLTDPKAPPLWTVDDLGPDGHGHLFKLTFDGKALSERLQKSKGEEDRNLYEAIVGQATVQLELGMGEIGPDEDCPRSGRAVASLFLRLDTVFVE